MAAAPLALEFVTSADGAHRLPDLQAEVALIGRSNVGKSSLVNALCNRKSLAKTSKNPGRTQLLNAFATKDGFGLIDCPGYGYAKVSQTTRARWAEMIRTYLRSRSQLACTVVLVDGEVGPTKLDVEMLDWLRAHGLAVQVVATKHDKVKASKRERRKKDLAAGCGIAPAEVIWTSAESGVGIDRLRSRIVELWGSAQ